MTSRLTRGNFPRRTSVANTSLVLLEIQHQQRPSLPPSATLARSSANFSSISRSTRKILKRSERTWRSSPRERNSRKFLRVCHMFPKGIPQRDSIWRLSRSPLNDSLTRVGRHCCIFGSVGNTGRSRPKASPTATVRRGS